MEQSKFQVVLIRGLRTLGIGILSILIYGFAAVLLFLTKENVTTVDAIHKLVPEIWRVFQAAVIPVALTAIGVALDKLRRWVQPKEPVEIKDIE